MTTRLFQTMILLALGALPSAAQCTIQSMQGLYYYLIEGEVSVNSTLVPYAELGKITANGTGSVIGSAQASTDGQIATRPLNGTYSVDANCQGSIKLTVNNQIVSTVGFQVQNGGESLRLAYASPLGVVTGTAYRQSPTNTAPSCSVNALTGSYGFLVQGSAYIGPTRLPVSQIGRFNATSNNTIDAQRVTNTGGNLLDDVGAGTYTMNQDCSGTATLSGNQSGTAHFALALAGGHVLILQTDTGSTVAGVAEPVFTPKSVLSQFVFGGGWYSALYLTNNTPVEATFDVAFHKEDGSPLTVSTIAGSTKTVTLAAHATTLIEAPNIGDLQQGYASFTLPAGVTGYGVFRQTVNGRDDQEAVVPATRAAQRVSMTYDDVFFTTAFAITNPNDAPATVSITAYDAAGEIIATGTLGMSPRQKGAFTLRSLPGMASVAGKRGVVVFTTPTSAITVLGLRFGGAAFTSIPTTVE